MKFAMIPTPKAIARPRNPIDRRATSKGETGDPPLTGGGSVPQAVPFASWTQYEQDRARRGRGTHILGVGRGESAREEESHENRKGGQGRSAMGHEVFRLFRVSPHATMIPAPPTARPVTAMIDAMAKLAFAAAMRASRSLGVGSVTGNSRSEAGITWSRSTLMSTAVLPRVPITRTL